MAFRAISEIFLTRSGHRVTKLYEHAPLSSFRNYKSPYVSRVGNFRSFSETSVLKSVHDSGMKTGAGEHSSLDDVTTDPFEDFKKVESEESMTLSTLVEEEIEIDSKSLPPARKQLEKLTRDLQMDWPQVTHQMGGSLVKLEKMYGSEHIVLTCEADATVSNAFSFPEEKHDPNVDNSHVPQEIRDVLEASGAEGNDNAANDDEQEEWDPEKCFRFDISIAKGLPSKDGTPTRLLVACSLYKGEWQIDRFGTDDGKMTEMSIDMYEGPPFNMLSDEIQNSFYAYLEERGIIPELPEKLAMLCQAKEQIEYVNWMSQFDEYLKYESKEQD